MSEPGTYAPSDEEARLRAFIAHVFRLAGGEARDEGPLLALDLGIEPEPEEAASAEPTSGADAPASADDDGDAEEEEDEDDDEDEDPLYDPIDDERDDDERDDDASTEDTPGADAAEPAPEEAPHRAPPGSKEDLARRLGRGRLSLVFDADYVEPGRDLVATGSPFLRDLEAFLAASGSRAYVTVPGSARLSLKAIDAACEGGQGPDRESLGLASAKGERVKLEERSDAPGHDLFVLYRLRVRSREREDRTACVRVSLRPAPHPEGQLRVEAAIGEPPAELADCPSKARRRLEKGLETLALEAADAELARYARALALQTQTDLRRSSEDDLKRLHAYYAGQIADYMRRKTTDLTQIRIEELEAERELRIRELIRSAEVRVAGEAIALLVVERPYQRARAVRRDAESEAELASRWLCFDRATGAVEWEGT